ncbi:MAG: hypothetical protein K2N05_05645 [Muribaculaceae bacterium]|nr:hypothetical protein [Muribaculaceae bacterium]
MEAKPYHLQGKSHSDQEIRYGRQEVQERKSGEREAEVHTGWTFQTLLNALADGDERCLFECISHLEHRIRGFEKRFGCFLQRRTQVLAGLQNYAATHGQSLTDDQIRNYRKSEEGRRVSMIYRSGKYAS